MKATIILFLSALTALAQTEPSGYRNSSANILPYRTTLRSNDVFNFGTTGSPISPTNANARFGDIALSTRTMQQFAGGWSVIVIPDTQYLLARTGGPEAFTNMVNWITNNAASLNLRVVLHEGDIVENYNDAGEWGTASNLLARIKRAGIPLVLANGNHDLDFQGVRSTTNFNAYFPTTWFANSSYGAYTFKDSGVTENHFLLQTNLGQPWLWLAYEFSPRQATLDWVSNTLATYPNHNVGIVTHAFTHADGTLERSDSMFASTGYLSDGKTATYAWTNALSMHKNLKLIFNGHFVDASLTRPGIVTMKKVGDAGNTVHCLLFNYQNLNNGQDAYNFVRRVQFSSDSQHADVSTYNPSTGLYETTPANKFTLGWGDGTSAALISENARVVGREDAAMTLFATNGWTFRVTGTNSSLEVYAGTHEVALSNNLIFRFNTNGTIDGLTGATNVYIPADEVTNAVVYLPFDEGFGNTSREAINGFTATNFWPLRSNVWVDGVRGIGIMSEGVNSVFNGSTWVVTNNPVFASLTNVSVSVWFKLAKLGGVQGTLVSVFNGGSVADGTSGAWDVTLTALTTIRFTTITSGRDDQDVTVPALNDARWHHVACTFDGATKKVYLDGVSVGTKSASGNLVTTTTVPLIVGDYNGGMGGPNYAMNGFFDEVKVFSRAITANEVATLARRYPGDNAQFVSPNLGLFVTQTNVANWPANPIFAGACALVNSNGTAYILTSGLGYTWTATNKIAP